MTIPHNNKNRSYRNLFLKYYNKNENRNIRKKNYYSDIFETELLGFGKKHWTHPIWFIDTGTFCFYGRHMGCFQILYNL